MTEKHRYIQQGVRGTQEDTSSVQRGCTPRSALVHYLTGELVASSCILRSGGA